MLKPKPLKACKVCKQWFKPWSTTQTTCSIACAAKFPKAQQYAKDARAFRRKEAERKIGLKRRSQGNPRAGPERAAQEAVHAFIRERDHNRPCIVHGLFCPNHSFDAGHYLSRGSEPALRFNTWNIHKQCSISNQGAHNRKHYRESVPSLYRSELVRRIGEDRVAWLEKRHEAKQYRAADLKRIARIFRRRARNYRKWRGNG